MYGVWQTSVCHFFIVLCPLLSVCRQTFASKLNSKDYGAEEASEAEPRAVAF